MTELLFNSIDKTYKTIIADDEVIIGNKDNPVVFEPHIEFTKWNKENFLRIKPSLALSSEFSSAVTSQVGNKIEYKNNKVGWYANPDQDNLENFKFGIILYEKPATNVFTFQLEGWEEFDFRGPIPANIDTGYEIVTPLSERIGGYGVFHKNKKGNQYKTGKIGIFYSPVFIDANNNKEKAQLEIIEGLYKIIISQSFLDNAIYPVKANDTFGNTTTPDGYTPVGGNNYPRSSKYNLSVSGNITKLTAYMNGADASDNVKGIIHDDDRSSPSGDPLTFKGASTPTAITNVAQQYDFNFSPSISLTSGDWYIGVISENDNNEYGYDFSGTRSIRDELDSGGYSGIGNWATVTASNGLEFCIYATYTTDTNVTVTPNNLTSITSAQNISLWKKYTKARKFTLPTNDDDLDSELISTEYNKLFIDDIDRVDLNEFSGYLIYQFKDKLTSLNPNLITINWNGQSSLSPSLSTVYLQIYNRTSGEWETIDSDSSIVTTFPTTDILDNFNRANEGPPITGWAGDWSLVSNAATNTGEVWGYYGDSNPSDLETYLTVVNLPSNGVITLHSRITDTPGTMYALTWDRNYNPDRIYLNRFDAGWNPKTLAYYELNWVSNYKLGVSLIGGTIKGYVDTGSGWTEIISVVDNNYLDGGDYSFEVYANIAGTIFDNFGGGIFNPDFTLTATKTTNLTDYIDSRYWVSCRIYQQLI